MFLETKKDGEATIAEPVRSLNQRVLLRAADIIEQRGLLQYGFGEQEGGPICALNALEIASFELTGMHNLWIGRELLMQHLGIGSVINWVDTLGRTASEVVIALRASANS